jgi:predicted DNA-binding protein (MmcQ/YjbR family)
MTLAQLRKYCLSLPEVTEEPHFDRTSFRVGGKIFVTARASEGHVNVFVPEQHREPALAMHGEHVSKLLWGGKVVGLQVVLATVPVAVAKALVLQAWESKATKTLRQKLPAR